MSKWNSQREATRWIDTIFHRARFIVEGDSYHFDSRGNYVKTYAGRPWFKREVNNARLHDAVYKMMEIYRPHDWHQLLLEWPHKSATDPNRLAYTRDERSGEADRQVITTIGKYLTRHFPDAPSDLIRDIVAEHTYGGTVQLVTDMDKMVRAVMNGPSSCMTKRFDILCDDGEHRHPYAVYAPSLGWSMAVRYDGDDVMGRCLVWQDPNNPDDKGFVRSYKREKGYHSHSGTDEAIESYLRGLGYQKWGGWPDGTPIMEYRLRRGGWLMPYIDGCTQRVEEDGFVIHDCGDIVADQTSGTSDDGRDICSDCGCRYNSEDEGVWVGPYEDEHVCGSCENNYTYVYGRRGNQYYIHEDRAVRVDGEYYHRDYLSDNNIVELHDGDFTHSDKAIYIDSVDACYHCDDDDICYAEDTNQYELKSDCWQCEETGRWWTDDEESIEVDGKLYHPDHAPEVDDEDEDEEEEVETAVEAEPTVTLVAVVDATIDERFSLAA